jgi:hypothetical protein
VEGCRRASRRGYWGSVAVIDKDHSNAPCHIVAGYVISQFLSSVKHRGKGKV